VKLRTTLTAEGSGSFGPIGPWLRTLTAT